jgi:molybdopterin molybdotransferase
MRIFTGAPIPPGADTVIQQEWIEADGDTIRMTSGVLKQGAHIRGKATQIRQGEEALTAGTLLTPGAIGFLANLGLATVPVYRRPVVDILVTGSELVKPGQELPPGHIYESNSHTLIAALLAEGITPRQVSHVRDDLDTFRDRFQEAARGADMVLITGGISVGDHDIVRQVFEEGGVHAHFYKVRQRPGKPLFFGQIGSTLVYALPGNPASVTSCFYQYVYPGLRKMQGFHAVFLERIRLPLKTGFTKKTGLTFFLKALVTDGSVLPLSGQLSYIMRSFAPANAVIMLEEDRAEYQEGEIVDVHLLGHGRA